MSDRIRLECPECDRKLAVPMSAAGKKIRCPGCASILPIATAGRARKTSRATRGASSSAAGTARRRERPQRPEPEPDPFEEQDVWSQDGASAEPGLPPLRRKKPKKSAKPRLVGTGNEPPPVAKRQKLSFRDRLVHGGVISGLLMMVGAAVWFFVGLAGGVIFFYPPILFIVGLVTSVRGLFDD